MAQKFKKQENEQKKPVLTKDGASLAHHFMEYYFRLAVFLNAVPFTYNKNSFTFHLDTNGLKYKLWFVCMLLAIFAEWCQVIYELLRSSKDETVRRGEWCLIVFLTFSWTFIGSCHFVTRQKGDEIVNYLNQALRTRKYFGEEKLPYTSEHKIVRGHISSSVCQCFFQCLLVAAEGIRGKKEYLYIYIAPEYQSVATGLMWALYSYYRVITNFLTGYFYIFTGILHVMTCTQILTYRKQAKLGFDENLSTYRVLQLLCSRYNETYAKSWMPLITGFASSNIILGNFGTLRFAGDMAFDKYMNFPLMAVMMGLLTFTSYPKMAEIKETSQFEKIEMLSAGLKFNHLISSIQEKPVVIDTGLQVSTPKVQVVASVQSKSTAQIGTQGNVEVSTGDLDGMLEVQQMMQFEFESNTIIESFPHLHKRSVMDDNRAERDQRETQKRMMDGRMRLELAKLKKVKCSARSCPTLAVHMGSFYGVKRSTVLTIYEFIIGNTISALLTSD